MKETKNKPKNRFLTGDGFPFIRIPRAFFYEKKYSGLSLYAKLLYSVMYNRACVSEQNGWIDHDGRPFIYFTIQEITELLRCGHTTAIKLLNELDDESGVNLIKRKKQGLGKPNRIYVNDFLHNEEDDLAEIFNGNEELLKNEPEMAESLSSDNTDENHPGNASFKKEAETNSSAENKNHNHNDDIFLPSRVRNTNLHTSDKQTCEASENEIPKVRNVEGNKENINKKNINKTNVIISDHIISKVHNSDPTDWTDKKTLYTQIIKENISYPLVKENFGKDWADEIVELMVEVICSDEPYIRINRRDYPKEAVAERFLKLDYNHIENVHFTTSRTRNCISNIRAYLITTIYRSYETATSWMRAKVNYDLAY